MKRTVLARILCMVALFFGVHTAVAAATNSAVVDPVAYMKNVADMLLADLEKNKNNLNNDAVVSKIIYARIVPYFDIKAMSRLVLGREFWTAATPAQQAQFQQAFTRMIVTTYSAAVEKYDQDKVEFYPLRGGYADYRLVSVNSVLIRRNGNKILVNYNLMRSGNAWKAYDFSIEGISMISSYREQFSGVLHQGGVQVLINRLNSHNQQIGS